MCAPPAFLALGAAVITAAGTAYGGLAANAQGKYQAKIAERNADLVSEQSRDALERGQVDLQRHYRRASQLQGAQRAAMAANGVDLGYGSALDVQQDTAMLTSEDAGQIHKNTFNELRGFDISAANERASGRAARAKGRSAMIGSFMSAGGTLLSGASQFGKMQGEQ